MSWAHVLLAGEIIVVAIVGHYFSVRKITVEFKNGKDKAKEEAVEPKK
jgi:hypothetical protein